MAALLVLGERVGRSEVQLGHKPPLEAGTRAEPGPYPERYALSIANVQPVEPGARLKRPDPVPTYSVHASMRQLDASILTGIHSGQWASGRAAGGILALDREREKRRGIDLTRGAFWQMHAGRMRVWRVLDLGVASCEIPHVVGAELSTALKRGRERRYGAGPEVRLTIPSLHARVGVRYERDSLAGSRSQGQAVVLSLALLEWRGK